MKSTKQSFSMQEITTILLKHSNITDGHYITHIAPSLNGGYVESDDDDKKVVQALIVTFKNIELVQLPEATPVSVDASKI